MQTLRCLAWVALLMVVVVGARRCPRRSSPAPDAAPVVQPPTLPEQPKGLSLDATDHPIAPRGSRLTLLGTGLSTAEEITIGGQLQPEFTAEDDETLVVEAIAGETPLGVQDITVVSADGTSAALDIEVVDVQLFPPLLAPLVAPTVSISGQVVEPVEWGAALGEIPLAVMPPGPGVGAHAGGYELAPIPEGLPAGRHELRLLRDGVSLAPLTVIVAPLLINEVDVCQPSNDDAEFVEILVGEPSVVLDGYVLVFFNGSNDLSYRTVDLSGTNIGPTSEGGFILLGSAGVVTAPAAGMPGGGRVLPNGALQNGPDAIALIQGRADDFPNGTSVSSGRVIDAIVYGTGDPDDVELLAALFLDGPEAVQADEAAGGDATADSMARSSAARRDGRAFAPGLPTPGTHNTLR